MHTYRDTDKDYNTVLGAYHLGLCEKPVLRQVSYHNSFLDNKPTHPEVNRHLRRLVNSKIGNNRALQTKNRRTRQKQLESNKQEELRVKKLHIERQQYKYNRNLPGHELFELNTYEQKPFFRMLCEYMGEDEVITKYGTYMVDGVVYTLDKISQVRTAYLEEMDEDHEHWSKYIDWITQCSTNIEDEYMLSSGYFKWLLLGETDKSTIKVLSEFDDICSSIKFRGNCSFVFTVLETGLAEPPTIKDSISKEDFIRLSKLKESKYYEKAINHIFTTEELVEFNKLTLKDYESNKEDE